MAKLESDTARRGFTLIELLLAIFIFSIVIVSVYGTYRATFHVINSSTAELERASRARTAINRIVDDFYGLVAGEDAQIVGTKNEQNGRRVDTVSILVAKHLRIAKDDILRGRSVVSYSSELDEESETFNLYRTNYFVFPGQDSEQVASTKNLLCDNVQGLVFTYVDAQGGNEDEWLVDEEVIDEAAESGKSILPSLVYIRLELGEGDNDNEKTSVYTTAVSFAGYVESEE